ncbi:Glutamate decarboxylase and related PLP-dependent protein [Gaiella occulta]|uniref:Glutamate decarboxylase and related PLP-dependent protein n=1 Tax=Gaiella occulta TaxID=1002870 RepID=A0A7M2Z0C3_9ACTN|nr:aminotransferase class V-fold PLP-dependent enzyme [Gaiella occulta]RDI75731.1 Glutamate decarboxylase and related PLP-dependent protein [Gaiella occulta]
MTLRLDVPRELALERAAEIVAEAWRSFDQARPTEPPIDERLRALLDAALPEAPSSALEVLEDARRTLDETIAQTRPRFFAFVASSGLEIGVLGDLLASCFDANLAVWAAAASEVEEQAVRWVAEFVGFPAGAGAFTSGGTISNMTALAAARERAIPGARSRGLGGVEAALYCSQEAHYSIERSAELLGIGAANVRALPIDEQRRLIPEAVAEAIAADRAAGRLPVAVVATAGTTLTGAVDPIGALADVCAEQGVWLHVDGAYGLPAATTPSAGHLFQGLDRADSVTLDAHKWLYLPKACGVLLVRRRGDLAQAFSHEEAYIPHERSGHMVDITLEYSRPFRALKLWLAFRAHGAQAFRDAVEENLRQARLLYELVEAHEALEPMCGPPPLSIVPFRHVAAAGDLNEHNAALVRALQDDGRVWVAPATVDSKVCLRPCFVNFRTSDDDVRALVDLAVELG